MVYLLQYSAIQRPYGDILNNSSNICPNMRSLSIYPVTLRHFLSATGRDREKHRKNKKMQITDITCFCHTSPRIITRAAQLNNRTPWILGSSLFQTGWIIYLEVYQDFPFILLCFIENFELVTLNCFKSEMHLCCAQEASYVIMIKFGKDGGKLYG